MEALIPGVPMAVAIGRSSRRRAVVVVAEAVRIVLASVLLFSGLAKLRAPYEFLASVYGYEIAGPLLSLVIATVLPWLEVLVAICLWAKILYRGALATASFLAAIFSLAVGVALYRQLDISCGCFLAADKISYVTLIRSICLLGTSILGLILTMRSSETSVGESGEGPGSMPPVRKIL